MKRKGKKLHIESLNYQNIKKLILHIRNLERNSIQVDKQRRKWCCWVIYVTTLDDTDCLHHGFDLSCSMYVWFRYKSKLEWIHLDTTDFASAKCVWINTTNPTLGNIFEWCFKAQSSKFERLFSLKRGKRDRLFSLKRGKRDVRALSFELSKMSPQVGLTVQIYHRGFSFLIDTDVYRYWCKYAFTHVNSFLLWAWILKCTITVVWVLIILETLGSQRLSPILEETLDIISFMRVHCDNWNHDGKRGFVKLACFGDFFLV